MAWRQFTLELSLREREDSFSSCDVSFTGNCELASMVEKRKRWKRKKSMASKHVGRKESWEGKGGWKTCSQSRGEKNKLRFLLLFSLHIILGSSGKKLALYRNNKPLWVMRKGNSDDHADDIDIQTAKRKQMERHKSFKDGNMYMVTSFTPQNADSSECIHIILVHIRVRQLFCMPVYLLQWQRLSPLPFIHVHPCQSFRLPFHALF